MKYRWMAWALLALGAAAQADVTVNFVSPDKFSDIKDNNGFRQTAVLKDIEAHLIEQAQKYLPGRNVRFDVTDVDLAGEVEPFARRVEWLRVMRSVTVPSVEFSYSVSDGDRQLQQGEVRLRDMNYQDGFNSYAGGDTLRYEKRMIDRWFKDQFGPPAVAATR